MSQGSFVPNMDMWTPKCCFSVWLASSQQFSCGLRSKTHSPGPLLTYFPIAGPTERPYSKSVNSMLGGLKQQVRGFLGPKKKGQPAFRGFSVGFSFDHPKAPRLPRSPRLPQNGQQVGTARSRPKRAGASVCTEAAQVSFGLAAAANRKAGDRGTTAAEVEAAVEIQRSATLPIFGKGLSYFLSSKGYPFVC